MKDNPYMQRLGYLLIMTSFISILSCEVPNGVGEDFVNGEILDVLYADSFSVQLSTVIIDSLVTSGKSRLLIGYHTDEYFGKITAKPYFRVSNDGQSAPGKTAEFEYAELELAYDGYYYYDTSGLAGIQLYPLREELELDDDGYLYNTDSFKYFPDEEGSDLISVLSFNPRPGKGGVLTLRFSNETLMKEVFELAKTSNYDENFDDLVPGFVLVPDTSRSGCLLGFSPDSEMIIHYSEKEEEKELTFSIESSVYFNQVHADRSETILNGLITQKENMGSEQLGGLGFIQGGTGICLKVQFPGVSIMREAIEPGFVFSAFLELTPLKGTYSESRDLPEDFEVYLTNSLNRINSSDLASSTVLTVDTQFDEDTRYKIDITNYLKYELTKEELKDEGLLIALPSDEWGRSVNQVVFGDGQATLKLYLLDYAIQTK